MDGTKEITTPEQVKLTYTVAGIGTRFFALFVDTCLQASVILLGGYALSRLGRLSDFAPERWLDRASPWVAALVVFAAFGVIWGYFIFWETLWSGQTPGKRVAGLRVLRDGGYPLDFRSAFVRNISRYVDFLPLFYGVGSLAMFISADSKRLGDYAAGTIVVIDARRLPAPPPVAPSVVQYRVLGEPAALNLRAVTREQFQIIERFLGRRLELQPAVRARLSRQLAAPMFAVIGMTPPADDNFLWEAFLEDLVAACRQLGAR